LRIYLKVDRHVLSGQEEVAWFKSEKGIQKTEAVKIEKPPWAKAAFKICFLEN